MASVGVHVHPATGAVAANVELVSGECVTVPVHVGDCPVMKWAARADCDCDAQIADLRGRIAIVEAAIAALTPPTGPCNPFSAFAFKTADAAA